MADENTNELTEQETQEEATVTESQSVTLGQMRELARRMAGNIADIGEVVGLLGVFFGECKTAADIAEKAVVSPAFEKIAGAKIIVKFTTANTADNATLNVNNTGAALVTYQGAAIGKSQLSAGKLRLFMYDGENYEFVGDTNTTHNTFSGATAEANGAKGLVPQPKIGDQNKYLMGNAEWGDLPVFTGATDSAGGSAGIVPAPIAGEEEYFLKGNGSWGIPANSGSSGGVSNYRQLTKMNITASANEPYEVSVSLPKSTKFQYAPPNVLLFVPGSSNVVATACDFNNGEAEDFSFDDRYVAFDGTMRLVTEYSAVVSAPVSVSVGGYLSLSEEINKGDFKSVERVTAGEGNVVGIALLASGGGSGSWVRLEEITKPLLIIGNNAYNGAGNLLAENWQNLTDTEKVAAFDNADELSTLPDSILLTHSISVNAPVTLGGGYVSVSEEIDTGDFETITDISVTGGEQAIGIALVSSGGGSGTWARFEEESYIIAVASSGEAYDLDGNLLSDNWANLTDTEKEAIFKTAEGSNPNNIAETLDAFHFEIYSKDNSAQSSSLIEEKTVHTFKVAILSTESKTPACMVKVLPKDQLIVPTGLIPLDDYEYIDSVAMTASVSGNAALRFAVTPDLNTYYVYDSTTGEWASIAAATAANILEDGMTTSEIANVPAEAWLALIGDSEGIGFAYALSITDTAETLYVDAVTLNAAMKGAWRAAIYGDEYAFDYPNNRSMRFTLYESGNWKFNYDAG